MPRRTTDGYGCLGRKGESYQTAATLWHTALRTSAERPEILQVQGRLMTVMGSGNDENRNGAWSCKNEWQDGSSQG